MILLITFPSNISQSVLSCYLTVSLIPKFPVYVFSLKNLGHKPVFQKILFYYKITPGRGIRYMKYISIFLTDVSFIVPRTKWNSVVIR